MVLCGCGRLEDMITINQNAVSSTSLNPLSASLNNNSTDGRLMIIVIIIIIEFNSCAIKIELDNTM